MKTSTKIWLIAGAALLLLGLILCAVALGGKGWQLSALGGGGLGTQTVELDGGVRSISVCTDTEDIAFLPSETGRCAVLFREPEQVKCSALLQDGILTIRTEQAGSWLDRLGAFEMPSISVYLPEGAYEGLYIEEHTGDVRIPAEFRFTEVEITASTGDVDCRASVLGRGSITLSTGDISVAETSARSLNLAVTTGKVEVRGLSCEGDLAVSVSTGKTDLTNVSCRNLSSVGSSGDITMENVLASGKMDLERSTGDVRLDRCDAAELDIRTDTGDVSGSLRSEKVFLVRSDTGRVRVPETVAGGKCKITTDTGDVTISVS